MVAPASDLAEREQLARVYRARPHRTREDYAHRYAAEVVARVVRSGRQPTDVERMREDGLDPGWFRS